MSNASIAYNEPTVKIETDLRTALLIRELLGNTNARDLGEGGLSLSSQLDRTLGGPERFDSLKLDADMDDNPMITVSSGFNVELNRIKDNL